MKLLKTTIKISLIFFFLMFPALKMYGQTKNNIKLYYRYDCNAIRDFDEFLKTDSYSNCNCKRYMTHSILIEKNKITISTFKQGKLEDKTTYDNIIVEETKDFFIYRRDDGRENGEQDFLEIVVTKNKRKIMYYWMDYSYNPHQVLYVLK